MKALTCRPLARVLEEQSKICAHNQTFPRRESTWSIPQPWRLRFSSFFQNALDKYTWFESILQKKFMLKSTSNCWSLKIQFCRGCRKKKNVACHRLHFLLAVSSLNVLQSLSLKCISRIITELGLGLFTLQQEQALQSGMNKLLKWSWGSF